MQNPNISQHFDTMLLPWLLPDNCCSIHYSVSDLFFKLFYGFSFFILRSAWKTTTNSHTHELPLRQSDTLQHHQYQSETFVVFRCTTTLVERWFDMSKQTIAAGDNNKGRNNIKRTHISKSIFLWMYLEQFKYQTSMSGDSHYLIERKTGDEYISPKSSSN